MIKKMKLKDVGIIITGNTPSKKNEEYYNSKDINFFTPTDFKDGRINNFNESVNYISNTAKEKARILPEGSVLVTCIGIIGKVGIIQKESAFNQQINAIIPNKNIIDNRYLAYCLISKADILRKKANAAVVPIINKTNFQELELDVPDLETQKEVVKKLSKIQNLIDLKEEQKRLFENLIKSQFVEMFGDPIINPKGFPKETVDDIIEFQGGSQPDKKYFEYNKSENNIRLIQIRDYKTSDFITYIPNSLAKRFCKKDDIMIGRYGPPIFQILQGIEGAYNVALMKAIPKKGNKEFIRYFLKQENLLRYLEGMSQRTAGQAGVEIPKLKKYPFPYPPIELQNQFAEIVQKIDKQKLKIQKSLELIYNLQENLMSKYFN